MSRLSLPVPDKAQRTVQLLYKTMEGRMHAGPSGSCPVDLSLSFVQMCQAQSCGKCVPCRIGLGQLASMLDDVLNGDANFATLDLMEQTARSIYMSADCVIGYGAAKMVLKSLEDFRGDYEEHITKQKCLAGLDEAIPCMAHCPAHVDISGYIALIADKRYDDAVQLIRKDNPFPTACAFICNHVCEKACRRTMVDEPVNIRGLKRYAVDKGGKVPPPKAATATGKKIVVVGGGPSGLTAAYYLQLMGHKVTVLERLKHLGGMMRYGIPSYRLPRERLDDDINHILSTGITVKYGVSVGKNIGIEQLRKKYDAIYLSIGAHTFKKLHINGETAKGVIPAVDMLREIGEGKKPNFKDKTVVVIGGGNVAMDASRSSLRLGAKTVYIVYRRTKKQMTALEDEIEGAIAEGCQLIELYAPDHIETNKKGYVTALCCRPQIIGAPDSSGRPRPTDAPEPIFKLPCDIVISAIGQDIEWQSFSEAGIPVEHGTIKAAPDGSVEKEKFPKIFAGGDCVSGPGTVIESIAAGKVAAANIDAFLGFNHKLDFGVTPAVPKFIDRLPCGRCNNRERLASDRKNDFDMVENNMTDTEAQQEALRCLCCDKFGLGALKEKGGDAKW